MHLAKGCLKLLDLNKNQYDLLSKEAIKRISITSSTKGEPIVPYDKHGEQEPNHDSTSLFIDMTPLVNR